MRVAFDYQCFQDQAEGGVSRYVACLADALGKLPGVEPAGWAGFHQGRPPACYGAGWRVGGVHLHRRPYGRLLRGANSTLFAAWARWRRADVCHLTYYRLPPVSARMPVVVTAHDCIHERFPECEGAEMRLKKRVFTRADHVVCVSESTRADVARFYGVEPERMTVVHHGGGGNTIVPEDGRPSPHPRSFALFVGKRGGYKNFAVLASLWENDAVLRSVCDLVCVGGEPWPETSRTPGVVVWPRVDDRELARLYRHAVALLYPSRYEGFGLPLLEAMMAGCPVVTTRGGALPEVADDAAWYCSADDPMEWREAVLSLARGPARREEWIARGARRAQDFGWDDCARRTVEVYRKAVAFRRGAGLAP